MVEEELKIARIWLHDWDLLDDPHGKGLPPEQGFSQVWALSKCQFEDTLDEAMWCTFLRCTCCLVRISL